MRCGISIKKNREPEGDERENFLAHIENIYVHLGEGTFNDKI